MKIAIVSTDMPHQREHANAMQEGLAKHGLGAKIYPEHVTPSEEAVICWGWRIGETLRSEGKDVLVMERGFIDRMNWCSLGWNGLNGRAARNWSDNGDMRLQALFPRAVRPWDSKGEYALIIGQVLGDCSVKNVDLSGWYWMAASKAAEFGLPVKFRPHPVAIKFGQRAKVDGVETLHGNLAEALDKAAVVITYNSNAGVDAMLAGKPTIVCDQGSMAWPVAAHNFFIQPEPDRRLWASRLAWSQFSLDEIRSGFAWDVVKDSQILH